MGVIPTMRPNRLGSALASCLVVAGTVAVAADDYTPPSEPRSEARYGALYAELRDADGAASRVADGLYPDVARPGAAVPSEERRDGWIVARQEDLDRRYAEIARRERTTVDDLIDLREEGDVRGWFADPAKRARLGKGEAEYQRDLANRREWLKIARAERKADNEKEKTSEAADQARRAAIKAFEDGEKARRTAARAASLFHVGENLERSGKRDNAAKIYREVIRDYPGTPSAEAASKKVGKTVGTTPPRAATP